MKTFFLILTLTLTPTISFASCQCVCSQGRMQAVCDYAYERGNCNGTPCNIGGAFGSKPFGGNGFGGGF